MFNSVNQKLLKMRKQIIKLTPSEPRIQIFSNIKPILTENFT
jgi:hypothetical protein